MLRGLLLKPSGREGKRGGMRKGKEEKEREGRKGKGSTVSLQSCFDHFCY